MNIAVICEKTSFEEVRKKLVGHQLTHFAQLPTTIFEQGFEVLFHFTIDDNPDDFEVLHSNKDVVVFLNSVKTSLRQLFFIYGKLDSPTVGFNGMFTFFVREIMELTIVEENQKINDTLKALGSNYYFVEDRVGMVTPRVIAMIINEAYFTVQEGTASRDDIDKGMKLGTNYPYGPFEWLKEIGTIDVYELLEALYEDTRDERYKVCPLLKREYLMANM